MATAATIKKNIAKLEAALKSKATPKSLKSKLEVQLVKSKAELSGINKGTKPKASTTKSTQTALQKLKDMVKKNKKLKTYKGAGVDLEKDADRPALPIGRRTAKQSGKTYYEYRANRIDVKQPPKRYPKLEKGGYMAKGGETDDVFFDKKSDVKFKFSTNEHIKVLQYDNGKLKKLGATIFERFAAEQNDGTFYPFYYVIGDWQKPDEDGKKYPLLYSEGELINRHGNKPKKMEKGGYMAKGGMSQGYDDKEDERLGMEHGKMSKKDLDSTHARRDDARFEERGKKAKGGTIAVRNDGVDEYSEFNGKKRYGVEIQEEESGDVLDYEYFDSEEEAEKFIDEYAKGGYMAKGGYYTEGGSIEKQNNDMLKSTIVEMKHHVDELKSVVSNNTEVEPWVIAKAERASTDLSDITHYLEGEKQKGLEMPFAKGGYMAKGGLTEHGLKVGDTIVDDMFWDKSVKVLNSKTGYAVVKIETGERKEMKAMGGEMHRTQE